jgi:hypothetical protein
LGGWVVGWFELREWRAVDGQVGGLTFRVHVRIMRTMGGRRRRMEEGGGGRRGGGTRLGRRAWAVQALGLAAAFPRGGWPLARRLCALRPQAAPLSSLSLRLPRGFICNEIATKSFTCNEIATKSFLILLIIVWFHGVMVAVGGVPVVGVFAVFAPGSALWPWSRLGAAPGPPGVCRELQLRCLAMCCVLYFSYAASL